jgi:hypothetical protein
MFPHEVAQVRRKRSVMLALTVPVMVLPGAVLPVGAQVSQANPSSCWSVPANLAGSLRVTLSVTLNTLGIPVAARVVDYSPVTSDGRLAAEAAVRAVFQCAPYPGKSGTMLVKMQR